MWHPTKNELQDWLDRKVSEFAIQENWNVRFSAEKWELRYIYT